MYSSLVVYILLIFEITNRIGFILKFGSLKKSDQFTKYIIPYQFTNINSNKFQEIYIKTTAAC